ncbi:DUF11 domain-containing protein [Neomegalonema sp.]|uniref:DUF11 domain-containing protein n=1 Tax=Neomegalonema sp. TaxID=2039713 RepID=UPI0026074E4E|nr:DUF11 domain-containing protein [Neomegalonema sp.]MDD2870006.1 DUF11 domain-containing protein [Neomegalonema sp.]
MIADFHKASTRRGDRGPSRAMARLSACLLAACLAPAAATPAAGQARAVVNPGFESHYPASGTIMYPQADVPGWSTTASDGLIEIWNTNNPYAPGSASGNAFAELNASQPGALYQLICFTNNEPLRWSFAHRNRSGGVNPQSVLYEIAALDNSSSRIQLLATQESYAGTGWQINQNLTGAIRFTGATGVYRLQFRTLNPGSYGNLLDDIQIRLSPYVEMSFATGSAPEGASAADAAMPAVVVDGNVAASMNVPIQIMGGTATLGVDYTTPSGAATFNVVIPPGTYSARRFPLGITLLTDSLIEGSETIQMRLNPDPGSTYTIASTQNCLNAGVSQTTFTILDRNVDLVLSKTVDRPVANVGSNVVFTLTLRNDGLVNATSVVATDQLPSGFSWISDSSGGSYNRTTGSWSVGTLAPGASASLTITARVNAAGTYVNAASVTTAMSDVNPANNVATATVTPVPQADLAVTKSASTLTPNVGDQVVFTLGVVNNGPSPAVNARLTDLLPAGFTFLSSSAGGAYNPGDGVWSLGGLASGAGASMTLTARVEAGGSHLNAASVASDTADPGAANNSASVQVTPLYKADVSVVKTASEPEPLMGFPMTFEIAVRNARDVTAHDLSLRDLLPSGYAFLSAVASAGVYDPASGLWSLPSLPLDGEERLTLSVVPRASGDWTNVAELMAMKDALGAPLADVDSTPGNGLPGEDDQDQAATLPRRGVAPPIAAPVCRLGAAELDWSALGLADGAANASFPFVRREAGYGLSSGAMSPGWPRVRGVGAGGAPALELQGTGEVHLRFSFAQPVEGLRLTLRGLGAEAAGMERLRASASLSGGAAPVRLSGGAATSVSGATAVGVLPGDLPGEDGSVLIAVDGFADELLLVFDRTALTGPDAPWSLAVGGFSACLPQLEDEILLSPDHDSVVPSGQLAVYAHRLEVGTGLDGAALNFAIRSDQGLSWRIHLDEGDGVFGEGDAVWTQGAPIPGGSHLFWLVARIPQEVPVGWRDATILRAEAAKGALLVGAEVADLTRVGEGRIDARKLVALDSNCDGTPDGGEESFQQDASIQVGGCAIYRILFENLGTDPAARVSVHDFTPTWTVYVGGSERVLLLPAGLTALPPTLPPPGGEGEVIFPFDGHLEPGRQGAVQFAVRLSEASP